MKKYYFLLIFVVTGYIAGVLAVTIGSDTTPTRFNTQQVLGDGDRVAGFAWLAAGFSLLNSTVTATFDSFFQVVGNIDLNDGTLVLNQDLIVGDQSTVRSLGNINGQGHIVEFGPSVSQLATSTASNTVRFTDLGVFIDGDVSLGNSVIEFAGSSMLAGRGNCLTFAPSSALVVRSNSSLLVKDITLVNVNSVGKLSGQDSTSTFSFSQVNVILDGNFSFTQGRFDVLSDVVISGDGRIFSYRSTQTSSIQDCGALIVDQGVTFSYDPRVSSKNLLALQSAAAQMILRGGKLQAASSGIQLTKGKLTVEGDATITGGNALAQGCTLGDGTSVTNNITINIAPAAILNVDGQVVFNNA